MSTEQARSDHITKTRQAATTLLGALDALRALRVAWDAGHGTWITEEDFTGANEELVKDDISAVSTTTLDALGVLLSAGHGTNLEKIRL